MNIKLYTTPTCGYCHQVKQYLKDRGVSYEEHDVSRDREAANEMVQATGQMGVPVIIVNGQAIIGFNRPLLDQLLSANQDSKRPSLGLSIADAMKITAQSGLQPVPGAYVGKVAPASPGTRAGLQPGDIITAIDGQSINNAFDMEHTLSLLVSGKHVSITFLRGTDTRQSEIIL